MLSSHLTTILLLAFVAALQPSFAVAECDQDYLVPCPRGDSCIPKSYMCDGLTDCSDRSDEAFCGNRTITCSNELFQCSDRTCRPKRIFCNGVNDCGDYSDELYCNQNSIFRCPYDWIRCTDDRRCIQKNWKCDGSYDCMDRSDENGCGNTSFPVSIKRIETRSSFPDTTSAKNKGVSWLLSRRKANSSTDKWGPDLHRIAAALYLTEPSYFSPGHATGEGIGSELTIQIFSKLLAGNITLRNQELALYIQALTVTCYDPRDFFGHNLVSELRSRVESSNYTNPFEILTLCNVKDNMTDKDIERVTTAFDSQHRPFWIDTQAIATMALQCLSTSPNVNVNERSVKDMQDELKKKQFRNGTVDNPITTALVTQALIRNNSFSEFFDLGSAITVLLENQRTDGSWGSIRNTYYVLPVLTFKSLLNISSEHCIKQPESEEEALQKLQDARGDKFIVQYSVWIGDEVDLGRTWRIRMKTTKDNSLYDVIETVKKLDSRHNVTYNVVDNKPYVSSLFGKEDDPELGVYWFTYVRSLQTLGAPKLIERSPVDIKVLPKQELILWYKPGRWSDSESSQHEEA